MEKLFKKLPNILKACDMGDALVFKGESKYTCRT